MLQRKRLYAHDFERGGTGSALRIERIAARTAAVLPRTDANAVANDTATIKAKHDNWQSLQVLDDVPATVTLANTLLDPFK